MITSKSGKLVAVFLLLCFLLMQIPTSILAKEYSDIPNDWSRTAIMSAVRNGLLEGSNGKISPQDNLTRAQMAAVITRAFGAEKKASLTGYTDVPLNKWYYDFMSIAVYMRVFEGYGGKLNPTAFITREEAFTVLARAFKLTDTSGSELDGFTDRALVGQWAKGSIGSLVSGGYVSGSNGYLNPKNYITRAEFAKIMDNLVKVYFNAEGTYSNDVDGNAMINIPGVTLKNIRIKGDLIIGDGVGDGDVTLDGVIVEGRTVIRGGGKNSIKVTGNSQLKSIIVARVDGEIRIFSDDGTQIGNVVIDGNNDVIIEGNVQSITILADNVTVAANGSIIESITIKGKNCSFTAGLNTSAGKINVEAVNAVITASEGSKIENITVDMEGTEILGDGEVGTVTANAGKVTVKTKGTSVTAAAGVSGVIAGTTEIVPGTTIVTEKHQPPVVTNQGSGNQGSGNTDPAPLPKITIDGISDIILLKSEIREIIVYTTPAAVTVTVASEHPLVAGAVAEDKKITVSGLQDGTTRIMVNCTMSGYKAASTAFDVTVNVPVISTASTTISKGIEDPSIVIALKNDIFSQDAVIEDKWTIDTGTTGLIVSSINKINDNQVRFDFKGTASDGAVTLCAGAAAMSGIIASNDLTVTVADATVSGVLYIYENTHSPGDIKNICLDYATSETFVNGIVAFELPEGFTAGTDDFVCVTSSGDYIPLTDDYISNSGRTVTIKNINIPYDYDGDIVSLILVNNIIPEEGTYTFFVKADADGGGIQRGFSCGTGQEMKTFVSQPAPIKDLRLHPGDGIVILDFSKPLGASEVILEQSTDDENNFVVVTDVALTAESDIGTITGLTNGTKYYYRLIVTGGVHTGISNTSMTIPTKVAADRSSYEIADIVTADGVSKVIINVTKKDNEGALVTAADAVFVEVLTPNLYKVEGIQYSGYHIIPVLLPASIDGENIITIEIPTDTLSLIVSVRSTDISRIGSYYYYSPPEP